MNTMNAMNENSRPTSFMEIFHLLGDGQTDEELSEELRDLVLRVQQTGRAGQISLTLKVVLSSNNTVEIVDKITVRKPEFKRDPHEFEICDGGNLVDAGEQMSLNVRVVGDATHIMSGGERVNVSTGVIEDDLS